MKKKSMVILILILAAAVIISGSLWGIISYVFIPRIIVPRIREYIDTNLSGPVKLVVKDISFNPFSGFMLEDVELSGPVVLKDAYILHSRLVDIDLALLPLLWKRIEVKRFEMFGVDLNIGRDEKGLWNFQPLLELDFMEEKGAGGGNFIIRKFRLKECCIDYMDRLKKDNTLERRFTGVDLVLTNPKGRFYRLSLSGGAQDRSKESIELKLNYNKAKKSVKGEASLNTKYLSDYWDYYLDDRLRPWRLKAEDIVLEMQFSYQKDTLTLDGRYAVDSGILGYGDLSIKGDALIKQKLKYVKGVPDKDIARIDLSLENISSLNGEYVFLDKGKGTAVITEKAVTIKKLSGTIKERPVNFSGKFTFTEPRELSLAGNIARLESDFNLKLLSDNHGTLEWRTGTGDSSVSLSGDITDFKDMISDLNIAGQIQMRDFSKDENKIEGTIDISGNIKGELDEASSMQGGITVKVEDLSFRDLEPVSLDINISIENGIFKGEIPGTDFYKGSLYGAVQMDYDRWGVELHIDKLDLEKFAEKRPKLEGVKGEAGGSIVCVSRWTGLATLQSGGYFNGTNCDLWSAPIFLDTEEGVESIIEDIDMPELKKIEGNFKIEKDCIKVEDAFCDASGLNLSIIGKYYFSGMVDFTVGVKFLGGGGGLLKMVLLPVSIGVNLVANCIQVKIEGRWPDLEQKTELQPVGWLTAFFPVGGAGRPNKYTLEKLWQ